jgi:hypothetical protein
MNKRRTIAIAIGVILLGVAAVFVYLLGGAVEHERQAHQSITTPERPEDATYMLGEDLTPFNDGRAQHGASELQFQSEPAWGDIDGDGSDDAAVLFSEGGSTYYVAAALSYRGGYLGTNAVPFTITYEPTLAIEDNLIVVRDTPPVPAGTSTGTSTASLQTTYLTLTAGKLTVVEISLERGALTRGHLVYGHESRTFSPCGSEEVYWLMPESSSDAALRAIYEQRTRGAAPYTPIYIVLVGKVTEPPAEGFGADLEAGFNTQQILAAPLSGTCVGMPMEAEATTTPTSTAVVE